MKKNRKIYIDLLILISSFGVVLMHCNYNLFNEFTADKSWSLRLVFEVIAYFNVPCFFMITGANLLNYREKYTTKEYAMKRVKKVIIPFIFWLFIGLLLAIIMSQEKISNLNFIYVINAFLTNKYNYAYWFFYSIIAIYASIPFITLIPKEKKLKYYSVAVILAFLSYSLYPWISTTFNIQLNTDLQIPIVGGYILYVLLGYILDNIEIQKKYRYIIYFLGILSALTRYCTMNYYSFLNGRVSYYFCGAILFTTVFYSASIFVLCKYVSRKIENKEKICKLITKIATTAFGIYLIHNYFCIYLPKIFNINLNSLNWVIFGTIGIYIISSLITILFKKVPYVKNIIP